MHESGDGHMLERILEGNDEIARHNREHFDEIGAYVVNIMSAPGAGKTMFAAATINSLKRLFRTAVIEGDMVGELDAERLREMGITAHQISTGRSCHLDAKMVARLLHHENMSDLDLVVIENVGNLVCPADFALGENLRVVLLSITEGDDKPYKYPVIFNSCDAVVLTKIDLAPHVTFNMERARDFIEDVNPACEIFAVSSLSGQGMLRWVDWLTAQIEKYRQSLPGGGKESVHIAAS